MGKLDPQAVAQLRAWEAKARDWPVRFRRKETGMHLICAVCGQTVIPVDDNKNSYALWLSTVQAALVAHLRQVHDWLESEINGGQDKAPDIDAGIAGTADRNAADTH